MVRVGLRMPKQQRDALDRLVEGGLYSSRSEALRAGARHIIGGVVDRQGSAVSPGVEGDVGISGGDEESNEVEEGSVGDGVDEQGGDGDVSDVGEGSGDEGVSEEERGEESVSGGGVFDGFFGQAMRDLERDLERDSGGDEG